MNFYDIGYRVFINGFSETIRDTKTTKWYIELNKYSHKIKQPLIFYNIYNIGQFVILLHYFDR